MSIHHVIVFIHSLFNMNIQTFLTSRDDLPKHIPTFEQDFLYGLYQLNKAIELTKRTKQETDYNQNEMILEAIMILDQSVGIQMDSICKKIIGTTLSSYEGLIYLPIYIVRRVEYENCARKLNLSEMDIGQLHQPFEKDIWYIGDIVDQDFGSNYLIRATMLGNHFAKRVLDWLDPEKGNGINPIQGAGTEEYIKCIQNGNRQRAIELGTMMVTNDKKLDVRPDETIILRMKSNEKKAMSANNIAHLLAHGRQDIKQNVKEAIEYYRMAIEWGSTAALGNLGYIYYCGLGCIKRDGRLAKFYYEQAISKGERNHVPRNLACLYYQGAPGIKKDYAQATHYLLLGYYQGDLNAKRKCKQTLKLLSTMKFRFNFYVAKEIRKQCEQIINNNKHI